MFWALSRCVAVISISSMDTCSVCATRTVLGTHVFLYTAASQGML